MQRLRWRLSSYKRQNVGEKESRFIDWNGYGGGRRLSVARRFCAFLLEWRRCFWLRKAEYRLEQARRGAKGV